MARIVQTQVEPVLRGRVLAVLAVLAYLRSCLACLTRGLPAYLLKDLLACLTRDLPAYLLKDLPAYPLKDLPAYPLKDLPAYHPSGPLASLSASWTKLTVLAYIPENKSFWR